MSGHPVVHSVRVDRLGGSHYAFCRFNCGWTGPFRAWAWRARRDGRKHMAQIGAGS